MKSVLMGGQACVLYGGAEFSRDTDLVILCDEHNLRQLQCALDDLRADVIAVPPFEQRFLEMGLAVHFRCRHPDADRLRVDVMSKLRGVAPFADLWERRTSMEYLGDLIDLLSLPDLVAAKKTQRDKDWVMINRLMESHYFANKDEPTPQQKEFWFRELRTPRLLIDLASAEPARCQNIAAERALLIHAQRGQWKVLREALRTEEELEREADRLYWAPLSRELERLRRERLTSHQ